MQNKNRRKTRTPYLIKEGSKGKIGVDGMIIEHHEREHVKIGAEFWNDFVDLSNKFDGVSLGSSDCAEKYVEFINATGVIYDEMQYIKNIMFDITQYGGRLDLLETRLGVLKRLLDEYKTPGCK